MVTEEQMRFQGMDPTSFRMDVSEPELQRQIGNAMSLCVIERLLNRLIPAAGLANEAKEDRWESGEAVRRLEESRDGTFQKPEGPNEEPDRPSRKEIGEIHFWNRNPVFRYYRLPNRWAWIKWDCVRRVIHKCANSGEVLSTSALRTRTETINTSGNSHVQQQGGCYPFSFMTSPMTTHIGWQPGKRLRNKTEGEH